MLKALLQILAISSQVSSVFRGVFSGRCCGEYSVNDASSRGLAKSRRNSLTPPSSCMSGAFLIWILTTSAAVSALHGCAVHADGARGVFLFGVAVLRYYFVYSWLRTSWSGDGRTNCGPFFSFLLSFFFFFLSTVYHFDNARKVSDCKRVWAVTEYYLAFFVGRPPTPRSPTSLQWTSSVQTLTPLCTLLWVALSRRCAALLLWPCDTWTCFVFFFFFFKYVNGVNVTYICTS